MHEDSYLDSFMEDHINGGPYPEDDFEDEGRDFEDDADEGDSEARDDDYDDDYDDYDDELARDQILERQELEDFEGINPFEDYDTGGGDW